MYTQHKHMYTHIPIYHKCVHTSQYMHMPHHSNTNMCTCRYIHHATNICTHVHTHRGRATWEGISTEKGALCGSALEPLSRQSGGSAAAIRAPPSRHSRQHPPPGQWRQKYQPPEWLSLVLLLLCLSVQKYSESCVCDHLIYLSLIFPRVALRARQAPHAPCLLTV